MMFGIIWKVDAPRTGHEAGTEAAEEASQKAPGLFLQTEKAMTPKTPSIPRKTQNVTRLPHRSATHQSRNEVSWRRISGPRRRRPAGTGSAEEREAGDETGLGAANVR